MARRPEHLAPPEIFYGVDESRKYTSNSRMIEIQLTMSERAVELLALPEDEHLHLLDLGCGSGLSGSILEDQGHTWVGVDISKAMLDVAREREMEGDLILGDLGQGLPFRAGAFDGAISISALQWLCNADKAGHKPSKRLLAFFSSLYACLRRGAKAVLQFYPENNQQTELVMAQATRAGFFGGLVIDYPHSTKAKKVFLVLMTGGAQSLPKALGTGVGEQEEDQVSYSSERERGKRQRVQRGKSVKHSRDWVNEKKERRRRQGKSTANDSKYTARRRCGKF
ncbi:probable 18S rRNA (guanine-N(7))-methyltransferase [Neocloeon triangulifer]|uniref:probable 18S rRNA (guanine-N(7))-methyltransferase n=1 Tax=Neocloeon triangulifer TaxID=2078957 RepID=UPI00286F9DE3|nr:probable 18S rRNA (guanine-N(7))-methyltransferase [Neocloeon triangulifer]